MHRFRFTGLALAALGGWLTVTTLAWSQTGTPYVVGIGDIAPEAAGIVLQGPENVRLSALKGRVVVVDFWASWCGPCIESMPKLNEMRHELIDAGYGDDFEVLSVATDPEVAKARKFLELVKVDYPVVADQIGISPQTYKLWRLPAAYLIDRKGRIRMIYSGYGPGFTADLKQEVMNLLQQAR